MSDSIAPAGAPSAPSSETHNQSQRALALGAIGVVFGDIGTSPLYAFRDALVQTAGDGIDASEIIGVLSLAMWSLFLVVTCKYVLILMRADNHGEGGVLALVALAGRAMGKRTGAVLALGLIGAGLFFGDAVITPALSVLSAVEGIQTLPGLGHSVDHAMVLGITLVILIGLFMLQSRGTHHVSRLFGPVCLVWFLALGGLGLWHISDEPGVLAAFLPHHAVIFLLHHGVTGFLVLGAVFLTVTGAEALTADMGHFGRKPIQFGWFVVVFPALMLNYLGQGALALSHFDHASANHMLLRSADWFFLMAPGPLRLPLVILAMLATIIASQAVITGAYSLTQQAMQLGLLPRLHIRQTSSGHAGQIYIGVVNWALLVGVIILVLAFNSSTAMASAYGIAVTGTMVVTTCLAFIVVRWGWKWSALATSAMLAPFLVLDLIFLSANLLRIVEGGWVPLLIGGMMLLMMLSWTRGRRLLNDKEQADAIPLAEMAAALAIRPPRRVDGTAIFLTVRSDETPGSLLHNLKHNRVLHARNYVMSVHTASIPHVPADARVKVNRVDDNFSRVEMFYGFMEQPDVAGDLQRAEAEGILVDVKKASYFIGRVNVKATAHGPVQFIEDRIFIFLHRNSSRPTEYFAIPSGRVIELGAQVAI